MIYNKLFITFLAVAVAAEEHLMKTPYGATEFGGGHLMARQYQLCSNGGTTCAQCFGAGNIVCQYNHCYNPSAGEQCCADGTYCRGSSTSCCGSAGAGTTGGSFSLPSTVSTRSTSSLSRITAVSVSTSASYTATRSTGSSGTVTGSSSTATATRWSCTTSDTDEACCQRAGPEYHWCSGHTTRYCYAPSEGEYCCSNGLTCDSGPNCCNTYSASAISPIPSSYSSTSRSSTSSRTVSTTTSGSSVGSSTDSVIGGVVSTVVATTQASPSTTAGVTSQGNQQAASSITTRSSVLAATTNAAATVAVQGFMAAAGVVGLAFL